MPKVLKGAGLELSCGDTDTGPMRTSVLWVLLALWRSVLAEASASDLKIDRLGVQAKLQRNEFKSKSGTLVAWKFMDRKSPHLFQEYDREGRLVLEKYDSDGNKIFESESQFDSSKNQVIELKDENQDGWFESKRVIKITQDLLSVTNFVMGSEGEYREVGREQISKAEAVRSSPGCQTEYSKNAIFRNIRSFQALIEGAFVTSKRDGLWTTSFGPVIHESCIQKYGNNFPALVQSSLVENLSCLSMLDGPMSRQNLAKIASLLENKHRPVTLDCSRDLGAGYNAMATLPGERNFPRIFLSSTLKLEAEDVKSTVFHELLHNCGHFHGPNEVEHVYACQGCCRVKPLSQDSGPCRICRGEFKSASSFEYQVAFSQLLPESSRAGILKQIFAGSFGNRKDAPLLYLSTIGFDPEMQGVYEQMYTYYKTIGVLTAENSRYLRSPQKTVPVTSEVRGLAESLVNVKPESLAKTLAPMIRMVDAVEALPENSPIRQQYAQVFDKTWYDLFQKSKSNPKLKVEKDLFWELRGRLVPKEN